MIRPADLLTGIRVLTVVNSPINGELVVVRDLAWGTYIKTGEITQSGGVMRTVWKQTLKKVKKNHKKEVKNCLILGLGGGDAARLVRKNWPDAKITGVDIDSIIVGLGEIYLDLHELDYEKVIMDAIDYADGAIEDGKKFDLVLLDCYVGRNIPKKFTTKGFVKKVNKLVSDDGLAIFNRLYHGENKQEAEDLSEILEKEFKEVTRINPEANVMFVCSEFVG